MQYATEKWVYMYQLDQVFWSKIFRQKISIKIKFIVKPSLRSESKIDQYFFSIDTRTFLLSFNFTLIL